MLTKLMFASTMSTRRLNTSVVGDVGRIEAELDQQLLDPQVLRRVFESAIEYRSRIDIGAAHGVVLSEFCAGDDDGDIQDSQAACAAWRNDNRSGGYLSCRTRAVGTDQRFISLAGVRSAAAEDAERKTRTACSCAGSLCPRRVIRPRSTRLAFWPRRAPVSPLGPGGPASPFGPAGPGSPSGARRSRLALWPRRPWLTLGARRSSLTFWPGQARAHP